MENGEKKLLPSNVKTKTDYDCDGYCYANRISSPHSAVIIDIKNDDEVIFIDPTVRVMSNSSMTSGVIPNIPRKKVTFVDDYDNKDDEMQRIVPSQAEQVPRNAANDSTKLDIFNVEDEMSDNDYTLQIEPYNKSDIVGVERKYLSKSNCSFNSKRTHFVDCFDVENDDETACVNSTSSPPQGHFTVIVNSTPSPLTSVVSHNRSVQESEIDEYDARMRACFGLDLSISNIEADTKVGELKPNASDILLNGEKMHYSGENEDVIAIHSDSDDDCVITDMDTTASLRNERNPSFSTAGINSGKCEKSEKKITETIDEIFKRMMPLAVPGALSLFAPDRNCLPLHVRPSKFCYYYFVSFHIVVKEIVRQEFYKFKEQIIAAKKCNAPPRCNCILHPLNQNANKLTLLTNPYSLYHKPNCHFARNSKNNSVKRKGPRRLYHQVSFHRVPQKREGKDFKEWSDIILRRRQTASSNSNSTSANWSWNMKENPDSAKYQPLFLKSESAYSNEIITLKIES